MSNRFTSFFFIILTVFGLFICPPAYSQKKTENSVSSQKTDEKDDTVTLNNKLKNLMAEYYQFAESFNAFRLNYINSAITALSKENEVEFPRLTQDELAIVLKGLCLYSELSDKEVEEVKKAFVKGLAPKESDAMNADSWLDYFNDACLGKFDDLEGKKRGIFPDFVDSYIKKDMKIASVGCGSGPNIYRLAKLTGKSGKVYAIDIDVNVGYFIKLIKMRRKILHFQNLDNLTFYESSFYDMRVNSKDQKVLKDNSLDVILMEQLHVLDAYLIKNTNRLEEDYDNGVKFAKNARAALKKGGIIIIIEGHRGRDYRIADRLKEEMALLKFREIKRKKRMIHQAQVFIKE